MLLSSVGTGRMLDWDYRRVKDKIEKLREARRVERGDIEEKGMDSDEEGDIRDDFPIEKARLRTMPLYSFFFIAVTLGYGWCVQAKVSIAGPLILQFLRESRPYPCFLSALGMSCDVANHVWLARI